MKTITYLSLLALMILTTGCDVAGLTGGSEAETGLAIDRVEVSSDGNQVTAHFNAPLDAATVSASAFSISSSFDNGRAGRQTPRLARYVGGANNSVVLTLRAPGLGNGSHMLKATGLQDEAGNANEAERAFEHRVTINTPKSFIVRKIVVTSFPAKKSNGKSWDPVSGRPDIYVSFQRPGATPMFVSETHKNARSSKDYTFNEAASSNDPGVPFEARYNTAYKLHLVDDDFGGNETMVTADVRFSNLYKLNNATSDELTVKGNRGFTAVIHGDWTY